MPSRGGALWVSKLVLVDADTKTDLFVLSDGEVLNTSRLANFSIRAVVESAYVQSVTFTVDEKFMRRENYDPFMLTGTTERGRKFKPWNARSGEHRITVTPYGGSSTRARKGRPLTLTIHVVDGQDD